MRREMLEQRSSDGWGWRVQLGDADFGIGCEVTQQADRVTLIARPKPIVGRGVGEIINFVSDGKLAFPI